MSPYFSHSLPKSSVVIIASGMEFMNIFFSPNALLCSLTMLSTFSKVSSSISYSLPCSLAMRKSSSGDVPEGRISAS